VALPYPGQLCYRNIQRYLPMIAAMKEELKAGTVISPEYSFLALCEIERQERQFLIDGGTPLSINHGNWCFTRIDLDDDESETVFRRYTYIDTTECDPDYKALLKEVFESEPEPTIWDAILKIVRVAVTPPLEESVRVGVSNFAAYRVAKSEFTYALDVERYKREWLDVRDKKMHAICSDCAAAKECLKDLDIESVLDPSSYTYFSSPLARVDEPGYDEVMSGVVNRPRKGAGVFGAELTSQCVEANPGPTFFTQKRNGQVVVHFRFVINVADGVEKFECVLPTYDSIISKVPGRVGAVFDKQSMYSVLEIITTPEKGTLMSIESLGKRNDYSLIPHEDNAIRYAVRPGVGSVTLYLPKDCKRTIVSGYTTVRSLSTVPPAEKVKRLTRGKRPMKEIVYLYHCPGQKEERVIVKVIPGETSRKKTKLVHKQETMVERLERHNVRSTHRNREEVMDKETMDEILKY